MKIKTSELNGVQLDWAVGLANKQEEFWTTDNYSTNWVLGGPIIEQERIGLDYYPDSGLWHAGTCERTVWGMGRTPLIAAMRCYVISKLGDEVEIPEELK